MKKISVVLIFILAFLFAPAVHAEVQNTLSDEILVQAKAQADLFLELKNALGLDWLDKYNAYLQNPASKPVPTWDTSISSLINKGYLSAAFPTDFAVSILGNEAQISRNISSQAVRNAVKIYIPSAAVSGNTVKLLVQRPAQWVAYESALNGKVSRDGSDSPDVLPGAQLDFGSRASINFISNDGKILGVNSLTYKGEELDTRFINASGDNMTGDLTIKGNKAWHAGNDGSGSGLDADLLDGKDSTYFTNASNLASGIVPVERLSGTYSIDISGNAATATNANYATSAGNADTVDGKHASDFALSGHTHGQYVQKTGDTMTGNLSFNSPSNVGIVGNPNTWTKIDPNGQRFIVTIPGSLTDGNPNFPVIDLERTDNWQHLWELKASGDMTVRGNPVWHAGNDGSGSGLDADTLDGKHASDLGGGSFNGIKVYSSPGTYTWTKNSGTKYVFVQVVGGGGGGEGSSGPGGNGGTSYFGSYCYATGGAGGYTYPYRGAGSGFGGDINVTGLLPQRLEGHPAIPGTSPFGGTIGHGGEAYRSGYWWNAGAGGGYAAKWIDVSEVSSVSVTVGAGGRGGSGDGCPGTPGIVIVHEFK